MTSISKALREMKNNLKTDIEENFISATVATGQYGIDKKLLQTRVEEGLVGTSKMGKKIFYNNKDIAFHIFGDGSK